MSWRDAHSATIHPRVLLADPSPLYREGVKLALGEDAASCLEAPRFEALAPTLAAYPQLELLVLDLSLPGLVEPSQLIELLAEHPVPVMLLADDADERLFAAGIGGVISKREPLPVLAEALLTVREGGCWLPEREAEPVATKPRALVRTLPQLSRSERRVLQLLASGLPNKAIGRRLRISESTVKSHVGQIYRKLQFDNRTLLATAVQALPHTPLMGIDPLFHGAAARKAVTPRR